MQRLLHWFLSWLLTPIFLTLLVAILVIWHPLIVATRPFYRVHKWIIELGNYLLVLALRAIGGSVTVEWPLDAPSSGPVIIISNHQSYFDIPIFVWVFRRYYAKFVAKKSLGRWLPSISYVLRTGGSALINRKNARQALPTITRLGTYILKHNCAACIFPEGTRAVDGKLKYFRAAGVKALLEAAPAVPVLPVAIDGAWKLMRHRLCPIPFGVTVRIKVFPPISRQDTSNDEILQLCQQKIAAELEKAEKFDTELLPR